MRRWQVIAQIAAALDRLYTCGEINDVFTADDADDVEITVQGVLGDVERQAREQDERANDPHEQAAARARGNDFADTGGRDWT